MLSLKQATTPTGVGGEGGKGGVGGGEGRVVVGGCCWSVVVAVELLPYLPVAKVPFM